MVRRVYNPCSDSSSSLRLVEGDEVNNRLKL